MGSDIFEKIDLHLQNHRMSTWTGTFRDYLGMVIKQPSLAQRAHARLYTIEFISIKAAETRRGSRWSNPGILSGETAHR